MPTFVVVAGLGSLVFLLAPTLTIAGDTERGRLIETLAYFGLESLTGLALEVRATYHRLVPEEIRNWAWDLYGQPALYLVVPFLLLLEYLFPCDPDQPIVSREGIQDFIWFIASAPTKFIILGAVTQLLRGFYNAHLDFLTISSATSWPGYAQIAAALLVGEFLFWLHHVARHKISMLWIFHAVHHSQKHINIFTEDRQHVVDRLAGLVLTFIPFYMFQVPDLYAVAVLGLYVSIHSRFVHANVRINLGWLGWVFTSPQFHRVHHSADLAHRDTNFGGVLSMFDYMFGTAHPSRDTYPETGIDDTRFPSEDKVRLWQLPWNWVVQTVYPFIQLLQQVWQLIVRVYRGFSEGMRPRR